MVACAAAGCDRESRALGLCHAHYKRARKGLHVDTPIGARRTRSDRFWPKVDPTGECWIWTHHIDNHGYGRFTEDHVPLYAHRVSYELTVGPIPPGLTIDHLCRTRACVNPAHLEPVTPAENNRRAREARSRDDVPCSLQPVDPTDLHILARRTTTV